MYPCVLACSYIFLGKMEINSFYVFMYLQNNGENGRKCSRTSNSLPLFGSSFSGDLVIPVIVNKFFLRWVKCASIHLYLRVQSSGLTLPGGYMSSGPSLGMAAWVSEMMSRYFCCSTTLQCALL